MGKAAKTFILICFLSLFFVMPVSAQTFDFSMYLPNNYFVNNGVMGTEDPRNTFVYSNVNVFRWASMDDKWTTLKITSIALSSSPANKFYEDLTLCIVCDNQLYEFRPIYNAANISYNFNDIYLPIVKFPNGSVNLTCYLRGYLSSDSYSDQADRAINLTLDVSFVLSTGNYISDSTDQLLQDQLDQDKAYHDQDKNDATTAGNDVAGAATDLDNLKSKWEILWYPIEFTNNIMAAFSGSDNTRYRSRYAGVVGYSYDDSSGFLVPVYSISTLADGDIPASPGGTVITFPSYTLPVLNVKLWDSYSYDLSQITEQYPVLFNAIYVIITILEVYWFVGFLRDKYEEVFGK